MTSSKTVLDVAGLTVRFGGVIAVDTVEFSVKSGQILGLVGPNGAGKTTIFDALCGFVASKGVVTLDGRDISSLSPEARSRARLGRSFQDARMFPSLTVSEALAVAFERHIRSHDVISSALSLPWVRRAEKRVTKRVDELIGLMGLGAFRDKFISELSTGSRRIVDLAAIIAHDPIVLLLDEPSSGIAQREAEALGPLLLKIRKETDTTMLVVEHDMPLLRSISDQILALETGRVLAQGDPEAVLADPRLIAAYLGTDQAVVDRSGAQHRAKVPAGTTAGQEQDATVAVDFDAARAARARAPRATRAPRTTPATGTTRTARTPRASTDAASKRTASRSPRKAAATASATKTAATKTAATKTAAKSATKPGANPKSAARTGTAKTAAKSPATTGAKTPAKSRTGRSETATNVQKTGSSARSRPVSAKASNGAGSNGAASNGAASNGTASRATKTSTARRVAATGS